MRRWFSFKNSVV